MPDDCEFQHLIDMIRPRPLVSTGLVEYDGMSFGYIHISRENDACTYEVAKNYPESTHMIHEGQAFIRLGSTKKVMTQGDRRRLESKTYTRFSGVSPLMIPQESEKKCSSLSALMIAALIGTWDEHYVGDKEVIQQLSGMSYENWITEFQQRQGSGDETVAFSQGKWCFAEHEEYLRSNARAIFDEHIDLFFLEIQRALTVFDPRYELPGDERYCAALHGKERRYSERLYSSLAKKLAMVANSTELFTNCSTNHISNQAYLVVQKILLTHDWKIWATLDWYQKYLAQASPRAFLNTIKTEMEADDNAIKVLFNEEEYSIVKTKYGSGLILALQTLAWSRDYFSQACDVLFEFSKYREDVENSLALILLPWNPQTEVPFRVMTGYGQSLARERGRDGWNVLFMLMPGQTTTGCSIQPPEYIQCVCKEDRVTGEDFWEASEKYLEALLFIANVNKEYIPKLVSVLDDVTKPMFDMILQVISEAGEEVDDDCLRYSIWDELLNFTTRHRKFCDAKWALDEEILTQIDNVADKNIPRNRDVIDARLFKKDQYSLIETTDDYETSRSELFEIQTSTIRKHYNEDGIVGLIEFAQMVENSKSIGECLAAIDICEEDEEQIMELLTSESVNLQKFAETYCAKRFSAKGESWANEKNIFEWEAMKRIRFLAALPICRYVQQKVEGCPDTEKMQYWNQAPEWYLEDTNMIDFVRALLNADRTSYAAEVIVRMIVEKNNFPTQLVYELLEASLNSDAIDNNLWGYYLEQIFKWLEENDFDNVQLIKYEWAFYSAFTNEHHANALEFSLAHSASSFVEMLALAYKSDNEHEKNEHIEVDEERRKAITSQAWKVLYNWKWVPGKQRDGSFSDVDFKLWLTEVKSMSKEWGCYEVAMITIGHVLHYSLPAADGFFINESAADVLNEQENDKMRSGFEHETLNARGVYSVDPSGAAEDELAAKWTERAEQAEGRGYLRFGRTLRNIADLFRRQKEHYLQDD